MRYNALLDTLQNLINYSPSQKELGEKLGLAQTSISCYQFNYNYYNSAYLNSAKVAEK